MNNNDHKEQCLYLINKYMNSRINDLGSNLIILEFLEKVDCFKFIKKYKK